MTSKVTLERFVDAGDHVVAIGRTAGTVNATGRPFELTISHTWEVRDGLVRSVLSCIDDPVLRAALEG